MPLSGQDQERHSTLLRLPMKIQDLCNVPAPAMSRILYSLFYAGFCEHFRAALPPVQSHLRKAGSPFATPRTDRVEPRTARLLLPHWSSERKLSAVLLLRRGTQHASSI